MNLAASSQKTGFRPGQLLSDTRYRSATIQVIVLMLVLLFLAWLVNNTVANLAERGKDISFAFLWKRAGYDIDQHLIPYTNDSTHGRALIVGLLNTLVVAVLASFCATVLGVILGVLRLSGNWLVARLTTVYVEVFRNVPLLLWILLASAILTNTRPAPGDFKLTEDMVAAGQPPLARMWFWDSMAVTNRGTNIPAPVLGHSLGDLDFMGATFSLSTLAILGVLIVSAITSFWIARRAAQRQAATGLRPVTWWLHLAVLFGPIFALLAVLGFHLDYPVLQGFNFQGGLTLAHAFTALLIALTLYSASYVAEIVRAGIMAISKGQTEAAFALGLRPSQTMSLVVLPQARRVIIPPLISQYLNITKNTTLGMAISYLDLKGTLGGITLNQTGRELECMLLMMAIYLCLSLAISAVLNAYNKSVQLKGR